MPKNIYLECASHAFLMALGRIYSIETRDKPRKSKKLQRFASTIKFSYLSPNTLSVSWTYPVRRRMSFKFNPSKFYFRGDTPASEIVHRNLNMTFSEDKIKTENEHEYNKMVIKMLDKADIHISNTTVINLTNKEKERFMTEEEFHDQWANSVSIDSVNPTVVNEMNTAPEMRYIHKYLGAVRNKHILDLGCGLGEVGVYFAIKGAKVTMVDISQEMLNFSEKLAKKYHVIVKTHKSSVENLHFPDKIKFDIIYAGNLFHHVNINEALVRLKSYLKPNGVIISRDPLAYNPIINVYRNIAVNTRSKDEHPIVLEDIATFKKHFKSVKVEWFWLTTLIIFVIMALLQRRNPNRERYWKKVEEEGNSWSFIYKPLEKLDLFLLKYVPILRPLCWNVVIVCRKPKQ